MNTKYAVMILACARHTEPIAGLLDETGVANWISVPALQARRMSFLQDVPQHRHGNTALFAFADRRTIVQALQLLVQAERSGEVCPDCVAYVWKVHETHMADVALDPVCEEVVDSRASRRSEYRGMAYYFCSDECLTAFNDHPDRYVERAHLEQRIGKRDLTPQVSRS